MSKVGLYVVAAVLAIAGLLLVAYFIVRGNRHDANRAMADVIEDWSAPRIAAARKKADDLSAQLGKESAEATRAAAQVTAIQTELKEKYTKLDLSPEEMAERLSRLRV